MKTAVVTGAGSGIGRATAALLAERGWRVYATDVDPGGLEGLEECLTDTVDVTDSEDVTALRRRVRAEAGGLDSLVANAGVAQLGPVADVPTDQLREAFAVNVFGVHRTVRSLFSLLAERDGTVVVVSSTHGRVTTPGLGAYAASKHALEGLVETLQMELASHGVDATLVEPAWVETKFSAEAADRLGTVDRSGRFDEVDDAIREGSLVDGGPLALSPDRVADTIHAAATTDDPRLRYPVGWPARLALATRWVPQSAHSLLQRSAIRLVALRHRLGERVRGSLRDR